MIEPKTPAAVVWMQRPDGRVLALTRGDDFADWHLPGGKAEDGETPVQAAARELHEETGLDVDHRSLVEIARYETRSGRLVVAFEAPLPPWLPMNFGRYPAGQPAWVPAQMLLMPSCSFAVEVRHVFEAVGIEVQHG